MIRRPKADPEVLADLTRVTDYDDELITTLATVGTAVNIPQGWSIIMQTTPADSAYIVLDGTVEIRKSGEVLASLGPGDVFGEIALVNHRLRSASVIASTEIRALRLGDEAVQALIEQDSTFADSLRSTAESRLGSS
jgi:CRP/FNR family cyclic AMP-dependent transcriptional regulator